MTWEDGRLISAALLGIMVAVLGAFKGRSDVALGGCAIAAAMGMVWVIARLFQRR